MRQYKINQGISPEEVKVGMTIRLADWDNPEQRNARCRELGKRTDFPIMVKVENIMDVSADCAHVWILRAGHHWGQDFKGGELVAISPSKYRMELCEEYI